MADESDQELIRAYALGRCERAFGELVRRHVDLVYSTALRVVRNASLAEEVTQVAFCALARNAGVLQERVSVTGWLHETTRHAAIDLVRREERRRRREKEAAEMKETEGTEELWARLAPKVDEALAQLSGNDREVILWRYFERNTAEEIGRRLGITAEAAQKRVARALETLRGILANRQIIASSASVAAVLSAEAVQSAPAGLALASAQAAAGVGAGMVANSTAEIIMMSMKAKIGVAALVAAGVIAPVALQQQRVSRLSEEVDRWRQEAPAAARLQGEVDRLTAEARAAESEWVKDRAELARLRGELATLRARDAQSVEGAKLASSSPKGQPHQAAAAEPANDLVRAEDFRNVGLHVPMATVQTLEWAKRNRDTNVIFNALAWADENSRAGVAAIFAAAPESVKAKYGTADAYVLSLFEAAGGPLDDRHTLTSYRVLEERIAGDEAILQIESHWADGSTNTYPQRYVRMENAWRQALDFTPPEHGKLATALQSEEQ